MFFEVSKKLASIADKDEFIKITAVVNGGFNDSNDRVSIFNHAMIALGANHLNKKYPDGFLFVQRSVYQKKDLYFILRLMVRSRN